MLLLHLWLWFGEYFCEFMLQRSLRDEATLRKELILEYRLLFILCGVSLFLPSPLVVVEKVLNLFNLEIDLLVICWWGVVALVNSSVSGLLD